MFCLPDHGSADDATPAQRVREDQEKSPKDALAVDVSDVSEDGEIKDDFPIEVKRKPSASIEEEPVAKKQKPGPEPMAGLFHEMERQSTKTPCVISVDQNEHIGGLYQVAQGFEINLSVNPGPDYAPSISLSFRLKRKGGWEGLEAAKIEWDTEAVFKRRFAMSNFEYGYASPDVPDPRWSDPKVLRLCGNKNMSQLLYIRFDSWDQAAGFSKRKFFKDQSPAIKKAMSTICQPTKSYQMEIWFLAPFDAKTYRRVCLSYIIDSLKSRQNTLYNWRDPLGTRYVDRQVPLRSTRRPHPEMQKLMFRVRSPERGRPQAQKAETAQSVEDAAHMLEQDASMAGRSTSACPEEQTMLTSGAGSTSPSAEEQMSSPLGSPSEFVIPRSKPLQSRGPPEGFVPQWLRGALDDSGVATYNDSNMEPEPDTGSDEVEEGQQEDEEEGDDPAR